MGRIRDSTGTSRAYQMVSPLRMCERMVTRMISGGYFYHGFCTDIFGLRYKKDSVPFIRTLIPSRSAVKERQLEHGPASESIVKETF